MAKDPTIKLAEQAKTDATKVVELLDRATTPCAVSPEAEKVLAGAPDFRPEFVEAQAKHFNVPLERVSQIVDEVVKTEDVVLERHEYSHDEEIKVMLRNLYQAEVMRRATCPYIMTDTLIGATGKESTVHKACGVKYESIEQMIVHQQIHLALDSGDPRTQRVILNDMMEGIHPKQEKSVRAALGPDERVDLMKDLRTRGRLRE